MNAAPLEDLAREFGISRNTIYRLIERHKLTTYKRAGDRRTWIDRDALAPLVDLQPKSPPHGRTGDETTVEDGDDAARKEELRAAVRARREAWARGSASSASPPPQPPTPGGRTPGRQAGR